MSTVRRSYHERLKTREHLGLSVLHEHGFVHRDISTSNILLVNGVAKLADLEYVKHEGETTEHNIRTVGDLTMYDIAVSAQLCFIGLNLLCRSGSTEALIRLQGNTPLGSCR